MRLTKIISKSTLPINSSLFYGWIIVIVSAFTRFFSGPGQTYSVSTFIDSYIQQYGWSRSMVSTMYSLGTLTAGLMMGLIGNLFDRKGHRVMTSIVVVALSLACVWMSIVFDPVMLLVGFFLIRLCGQGSMGLSSTTLPLQWFVRRRGFVLSVVSIGGVLSSALLPPVNTWLIQSLGWPAGWRIWALLLGLVMMPMTIILIRDRPEDVGLVPDTVTPVESTHNTGMRLKEEGWWSLREALETRAFWLLLFCSATPSAILTALTFHHISIMAQIGLSVEIAAMILSAQALVRLPMVFLAGLVVDRINPRILMVMTQGLLLFGICILYVANGMTTTLIYGAVTAVMLGFQIIVSGVIWPYYYGRRSLGSIRGVTMMVSVISSAMGPLPFGVAFDIFGGYQEILLLSLLFPAIGMIAAFFAKKPVKC
ncbi:MAG: MFS transporter [Candidatus Bathyarchaeota archaeon]|jgi:MFS family permease|nr:MFS transporter [Candidatus Bathyarchaeota archaeon]